MTADKASYASNPALSRGREFAETSGVTRGPRTAFQRDRDRIIHSISFRRLRHKTQVFVMPDGDHYRVRLTHSLEVAQIGRTIARALGLEEDLTEALCLAHDIGHPPFGHAGEAALSAALAEQGGFDHNAHTLRNLMRLESPYPLWPGLNLSWEVLEGLAKHNGPVSESGWALTELDAAYPLDLTCWPSLEAQVAAVADDIAYDNHDIDDGLRAGILDIAQLLTLPFVAEQWHGVVAQYPGTAIDVLQRELVRGQIGLMVNDVIHASQQRIAGAGIASLADVLRCPAQLIGFSDAMRDKERRLKSFMYDKLYLHTEQVAAAEKAEIVVAGLVEAYRGQPELLPPDWRDALPDAEPDHSRHIADFVAGMTDRYALKCYAGIYGAVPDGLGNV